MQHLEKSKKEKKDTHDYQTALNEVVRQLNSVRERPHQSSI